MRRALVPGRSATATQMSLVLQDRSSSPAGGVKVDTVSSTVVMPGHAAGASSAMQWDYSPKSMDADGTTSNGGTCGSDSVIGELNGDCSTDDTASLVQTAIIKQVSVNTIQKSCYLLT